MIQIPSELTVKVGYRSQADDRSIEADMTDFYMLRQLTNTQRLIMGAKLTRWARAVSSRGMRKANQATFRERFAQAVLGDKWLPVLTPTSDPAMWIQDPSEIARLLHPIFERLNIPYYITGGVAAIAYGDPRTTRDLDVVIELNRNETDNLVQALEEAGFYCPPGAVEELQAGRGRVLSVTHTVQVLNADLVVNEGSEFDCSKMARRQLEAIDEAGQTQFWLASPEDVILSKLQWGKPSQSQKQWNDVLGILKVQYEGLDYDYLIHWAKILNLFDDLEQAMVESGVLDS